MYEDILVSVITCVYNTPIDYLKTAVQSILSQTHKNFEYFIVDDCSDNDLYTDEIFSDSRIKIIRLKENSGPSAARNAALSKAKGKYIAIMDSDDISLPCRFERQIDYMENHTDVVALGSWFTHFGEKNNEVKRYIDDNEYYRCCLLFGNAPTIINPSVMIRHETLKAHNIRYDDRLRKGEDYKMWVQLSQKGRCTNIHENLFRYRVHNAQTSQKLRTRDISPYDWIVMKEQFNMLDIEYGEAEEAILKKDFRSSEVDAFSYFNILKKIEKANQKSGFFAQDKLEKRLYEQWQQKVYNTGFKDLLCLYRKLSKDEKKKIRTMEIKRIKRKLTRAQNNA